MCVPWCVPGGRTAVDMMEADVTSLRPRDTHAGARLAEHVVDESRLAGSRYVLGHFNRHHPIPSLQANTKGQTGGQVGKLRAEHARDQAWVVIMG